MGGVLLLCREAVGVFYSPSRLGKLWIGYQSYGNLIYTIKMRLFLSCSCVNNTVWMHHMNANKTHGEKAKWELYKNVTCCFEQIKKTTPHKTATAYPHLPPNPNSKTNKVRCGGGELLEKQGQTHKWHSTNCFTWTCQCWSRTNLHQLCADIGCSFQNLPVTRKESGWKGWMDG